VPTAEPGGTTGRAGQAERVVLAQRRGQTRRSARGGRPGAHPGRRGAQLQLIRSQLALAAATSGHRADHPGLAAGHVPDLPGAGRFELFGLRLPWLLLGVLAYPFLLALGWMYAVGGSAEQCSPTHIQN